MSPLPGLPAPGQIVRARARRYLVEEVVRPPSTAEDTRVRLACLDDDAQGEPLEVLWERELDAEILAGGSWAQAGERGFDPPARFAAYLHALRWGCVTATNPRLFQAPYRAGIQVRAYQLEPLRKALSLPYASLFVADDVGLGKTIEAGLVMRELMLRQKVRRVVVACPPSVVLQWRDELLERFGLRFAVYDRQFQLAKRRERGWSVNPFSTHTCFVLSHALLRDEAHAALLRDWITADDHLRPEDREPALFILDEAHNAAPASGAKYAVDSHLTRVVRKALEFDATVFRNALDLALDLNGSAPLEPVPGEPGAYRLPQASPLLSDRSWTDTRRPRPPQEKTLALPLARRRPRRRPGPPPRPQRRARRRGEAPRRRGQARLPHPPKPPAKPRKKKGDTGTGTLFD